MFRSIAKIIFSTFVIIIVYKFFYNDASLKNILNFFNYKNSILILITYILCIIQVYLSIEKFKHFFKIKYSRKLIEIFFKTSFINFIFPAKLGEINKIYFVKKNFNLRTKNIIKFIMIDKFAELIYFTFFFVFAFSFLNIETVEQKFIYLSLLIFLISLLFLTFCFFIVKYKIKILNRILELFLLFFNKKEFIILNLFSTTLSILHVYLFLMLINVNLNFEQIIFIASFIYAVSFFPISYNGIGIRELALVIFINFLDSDLIIVLGIFYFSRGIPASIIGSMLYLKLFNNFWNKLNYFIFKNMLNKKI